MRLDDDSYFIEAIAFLGLLFVNGTASVHVNISKSTHIIFIPQSAKMLALKV